ncbi:hypothetical protein R3W88_033901 [Solanum pinnatisectum]|uniref:U-box domain-containing protein n=1 Tax=Solanum pinnatisectum TaxID=50273 RepID=A0AAV9K021_9SOLN|nr:hypothetical protein R3W88_033901 [Solanum pinnatisectum]
MCFANDFLIFCRADIISITLLKKTLQNFSNVLGLQANETKSSIYVVRVPQEVKNDILTLLGFDEGTLSFKYLGCFLLVENITSKVRCCSARLLSYVGRLQHNDIPFKQKSLCCPILLSLSSPRKSLISSRINQREGSSPSHPHSLLDDSLPRVANNMLALNVERISIKFSEELMEHSREINSHGHSMLAAHEHSLVGGNEVISRSAEDVSESQPAAPLSLQKELKLQSIWRRPSKRFPRIEQLRKLVQDLNSNSIDVQRDVTTELRLLAKHNMDNRVVIANCGSINLLVNLLHSKDMKVWENAVTTLPNLSINANNKCSIANANAIEPLIHALHKGSCEARENSVATLFSLSSIEDCKMEIGRAGAFKPLMYLLENGTPRGKNDVATTLFNLSILHENKARIEGGIPILVEVVELGSARGKENVEATLLQLCTNNSKFYNIAQQLLRYFRNQWHGNALRG